MESTDGRVRPVNPRLQKPTVRVARELEQDRTFDKIDSKRKTKRPPVPEDGEGGQEWGNVPQQTTGVQLSTGKKP